MTCLRSCSFPVACMVAFGALTADRAAFAQNVTSATQQHAAETADEKGRRESELRQLEEALAASG
jgi:hypothetical protein